MTHFRDRVAGWLTRLAAVVAISVGKPNDGLILRPSGTALDTPWADLYDQLTDAREAWRANPLARRMVGLITAYTVGNGITVTAANNKPLNAFIKDFWHHNRLDLRLDEWSDELSRSGELFPVLFTNPVNGMTTLRAIPACLVEVVNFDLNDYERELSYEQTRTPGETAFIWYGPAGARAHDPGQPLMLHYAINRPTGAVRGESDLAPILPWLRRYARWLEDRVRLNAATRAFLWIVHAPARLRTTLEERYRTPPEPGSLIIAESDVETWEAVTPTLHAVDAEKDGRAIRWMIVAGGPGTALLDLGEGEDSSLATGQVQAEQRRRFLRRRQTYFTYLLSDLILHAWRRYLTITSAHTTPNGLSHPTVTPDDLTITVPDISPADNQALASAAASLAAALASLANTVGQGEAFRRVALRMFAKFAGEQLTNDEIQQILTQGATHAEANADPASVRPGDDARRNGNRQPA